MPHVGGKSEMKKKSTSSTKRHFTVVMGNKEHGLYVSSSPSSAARKAVSKLCATDKKKKVQFSIREITQGSKKKTYGPYLGEIEKLAKQIELKGRIIRYKPVAKLDNKKKILKGGLFDLNSNDFRTDESSQYKFHSPFIGRKKLFFGKKIEIHEKGRPMKYYFPIVILSDGSFQCITYIFEKKIIISKYKNRVEKSIWFSDSGHIELYKDNLPNNEDRFGGIINGLLDRFREERNKNNNSGNENGNNSGNGNNSSIPFSIKDEQLEYYHRDFKEFKSSITLYGEYHREDYCDFLKQFIDSLYSTSRRQIIIVEATESEQIEKNNKAILLMEKNNNQNIDKKRKIILSMMAYAPMRYFKTVLTHGGEIPNTEIILGDVRLTEIFIMIMNLDEKVKNNPSNTIDEVFFNEFMRVWQKQLSVLGNSEDFSEIKDEIQKLLFKLNNSLTNQEFEEISNKLIEKWVYLCNLNMMKYIKQYLGEGVDIILFIGAMHMNHLIAKINKLYPVNSNQQHQHQQQVNNNLNSNTNYWFYGKKRINLHDMVVDTIYKLRHKHSTSDLDFYKVIEKDDEKDIIKLAKLKTPMSRNFNVSIRRPKIMTLKISNNSIYGYEYNINSNQSTEVFRENESN